jgi:hypothetical protein
MTENGWKVEEEQMSNNPQDSSNWLSYIERTRSPPILKDKFDLHIVIIHNYLGI